MLHLGGRWPTVTTCAALFSRMVLFMLVSVGWDPVRHRQPGEMACGSSPDCPRAGRRVMGAGGSGARTRCGRRPPVASAIRLLYRGRWACCSARRWAALLLIVGQLGHIYQRADLSAAHLWLIRNPKSKYQPNPTSAAMTSFRDMFDTVRQVSGIPVFAMPFSPVSPRFHRQCA